MSSTIPVVDLAKFETVEATSAARELDKVCCDIGFLVIKNHGVSSCIQNSLYIEGSKFFNLPMIEKMKVRRPRDDQNRGYIPYGEETLAKMHGVDTPPDYKEVFAIGPFDRPNDAYHAQKNSYPNFAPNLWPVESSRLKLAMTSYFSAMDTLSQKMASYFALALGLPKNWFHEKLNRHASQLRLLNYPAPDKDLLPGQLRCGAHTDLGMMTILRNETAMGGLQVQPRGGDWIDAPALDDTFIVNIGDLLMRWTNDRWVSTPHRVSVPKLQERSKSKRMSIGYFTRPNYDTPISCITTCMSADKPKKYPTTTVKEYNDERFSLGAGKSGTKVR